MEVSCDGPVLLVGDGDFSFSLSLLNHGSLSSAQVTTSNLETPETIQQHKLARDNMFELESRGACVLLEVDARELHTHPVVSQKHYTRIIFNFPLADRHNIKKNRALLADFFSSCSQVLTPGGQVMVTLCKGQGGTPADQPQRSWHDSWQALAMAANASFILADIYPFEASRFPEYHSVGFRFQDKSFDTDGSLVHVFEKADMVCPSENILARGSVELSGTTYSCSQYIAEKLKRNPLEEESSPVCWMKRELEQILNECFFSSEFPSGLLNPVLPGYKSGVCFSPSLTKSEVSAEGLRVNSDVAASVDHEDALTEMKKQKDDSNLLKKKEAAASQFAHGVEGGEKTRHKLSTPPEYLSFTHFIPNDNESVYVLIKNSQKLGQPGVELEESNGIDNDVDKSDEPQSRAGNAAAVNVNSSSSDTGFSEDNEQPRASCDTDRVYHHRVSLLESLASLCSLLSKSSPGKPDSSCAEQSSSLQIPGSILDKLSVRSSVTIAGQCCRPRPIEPNTLPVYHELMFIHKLPSSSQDKAPSVEHVESAMSGHEDSAFEQILSRLLSSLQNASLFRDYFHVETHVCQNTQKLNVDNMHQVAAVKFIYSKRANTDNVPKPIGVILKATINDGHNFFVTIFHLDSIVCQVRNIPDPRLLWSNNAKVLRQLEKFPSSHPSLSHNDYQSISLYPMKFVHDLSFWENSSEEEPFDERDLSDVIRYVSQDAVVKVSLMDKYRDPETGRASRCYRLHFQSHSLAFPYAVSWKLQSVIRIEVARRLGVVLR